MKYPWAALAEAPGWRALFEASNSPVKQRIDALMKETQDISTVDPVASMRARAMLYGILEVKRAVDEAAKADMPPPVQPEPQEPFRDRALRLGRSLLPRRLG